ncbi:LysM peptidoglycan-binding domain-containing protein [Actinomyces oris]|uniref:LysM peptidoglycan-binding domain-containing protein n=1 Tax=Actinomyces oris TaxID=544580 RepID=A0AAW9KPP0_9ACTO|nr:LysM peptidoglycan-binding domain-containing protein [Actinomyces oris]MEA1304019.1 LysM peptidoglycan-binding domain-containing protein [Actinomyces oris]
MSAIAIPLPSRQASRARTDEPVAGPASGRGGGQSSRRPRLRLVTEDFVPEALVRSGLEGAPRPVSASVGVAALPAAPAMRRPAAPVALRGRRTELERLAPQHPAVRAAGLRRSAQQEEDRRGDAQSVGKSESVPSRPRKTVKEAVRSRAGLRLLRGGLAVIVAAFVLTCSGLAIGALVGLVSAAPATAVAQVPADTTTTVVRPGQSLWDIAEASGTSDVPGMVARIAELNDLKGTTIRAGQTLEIPAV